MGEISGKNAFRVYITHRGGVQYLTADTRSAAKEIGERYRTIYAEKGEDVAIKVRAMPGRF